MSSVNNSYETYHSSTENSSTASTAKVVTSAALPADTDDISPSTSNAAAQALAASGAAPVLTTPDGQKVSMAAYGRVMTEFVQKFKDMVSSDAENDIQQSAAFYQTIITNILEIEALLSQQQDLEGNINGLMTQYAQSAAAVNAEIAKFNQNANTAQDQAVIKSMQNAITTYNQALATYNQAQADFASGTITQADLDQATLTFTDAQTAYNNAVTTYNNYGAQRNQSLTAQIKAYNAQIASGFGGLMTPVNASIDQYNAYAQEAGVATLGYPSVQQVKAGTYMWASLPTATTSTVADLPARPSASTIAAELPPNANDNLDAFIGKIYDYISGIVDALLANLQLLVAQKNYAENADEYDNSDTQSQKSNSLNPVLDSSATNGSSTELFASGSATYMQGASSQSFLTPFFAISTPDFTPVIKQAIKKNDEKTSTATNTLLRAAAEQYLIAAGLLGGKSAVGLLGEDVASIKAKGNASKIAIALGFTWELQKLSDSDLYDQGVSSIMNAQGVDPSAESTQKDAAALLRFNGALLSLFQLSQALNSPDLIHNVLQLANGNGSDQEQLKQELLEKTTQLLQPELSKAKSQTIAEMLVNALLGDGSQSIVNTLKSTIAQYNGQEGMTQALQASMDRISSSQVNLDPLSKMLSDPGNNMLYAAKMGVIYSESKTHNHESGLQFPV